MDARLSMEANHRSSFNECAGLYEQSQSNVVGNGDAINASPIRSHNFRSGVGLSQDSDSRFFAQPAWWLVD